jgi:hypothetical protein
MAGDIVALILHLENPAGIGELSSQRLGHTIPRNFA